MDMQNYEWVVTALAEEIAADPDHQPEAVIAKLRSRLAYACADPGFGANEAEEQARIALVEGVARRLELRRKAASVTMLRRTGIAA